MFSSSSLGQEDNSIREHVEFTDESTTCSMLCDLVFIDIETKPVLNWMLRQGQVGRYDTILETSLMSKIFLNPTASTYFLGGGNEKNS